MKYFSKKNEPHKTTGVQPHKFHQKIKIMKYIICTIALFFSVLSSGLAMPGGVEPIKIEPITKIAYDHSFYAEQTEIWKQETEKNNINSEAWLNYYRAARYANMFADSLSKKYNLDKIVANMPTTMANTFGFNYILFIHNDLAKREYGHLLKAHELEPERSDAYVSLINYYIMQGDDEKVTHYSEALFNAGEFAPSLMAWNYNMLASVEKDGILLTHGDNDTYPSWTVQMVKNFRKDVKVLNVNLLMQDEYREKVFNEMGLDPISSADFPAYQDMYIAITQQFTRQADRPVYVATTIPEFIRNALGDSLYLVGMAFKYSNETFDNVAFLKNNFENKFLKDHLHIQLEADTGSNVIANMNMRYLPALITLRRHYMDSGNTSKANELEPMIRRIAKKAGREEYISQYLNIPSEMDKNFVSAISIRTLQKGMAKVRGSLYAGETEVTNDEYEAFLMDLLKNKEFELLEICKTPKTDWRSLMPEKFKDLPDSKIFDNSHPDDGSSPVQNISYEAAIEYCKWITKVYNNSTDKKKEHRKVEFRLPSEEEWEYAAHGNLTGPFPWGGHYYRNAKFCFLYNTEVANEKPCTDCSEKAKVQPHNDGGFFPVKADAYFPNNYGLYNTCGNVAEMISVKGIAKGGSWEDRPDDSKIISQKKYTKPSPAIGFRVFMQVK